MADGVDWRAIVFDPDWIARLDYLAGQRFGEGGLAEEASHYVLEKISENQWSALRGFAGRAKPQTFLNTIARNFLEEFSRKRFGRPRPPTWLQEQGELWVQIWHMICLERQLPESVVNVLTFKQLRETDFVWRIVKTIKSKLPWCGDTGREISTQALGNKDDMDLPPEEALADHTTPGESMDRQLKTDMLMIMSLLLSESPGRAETTLEKKAGVLFTHWSEKLAAFCSRCELDNNEKIILRMHFLDGLKLSAIAFNLRMQSHLPGRILKRTLEKITRHFQDVGIRLDDLRELLDA